MAHFFGEMTGRGKVVKREGTAGSGLWAHLRGWHVGVEIFVSIVNGKDTIELYQTGGSAHMPNRGISLVATISEGGQIIVPRKPVLQVIQSLPARIVEVV